MNTLEAIRGIFFYALLVWLLFLVARSPRNIALRFITVLVAGWAIGFPFGVAASSAKGFIVSDPMVSKLIAFLCSLVGQYSLVCFLLFIVFQAPQARRRALWQIPGPVVVGIILVVCVLATPAELRAAGATMVGDAMKSHYASSVPSIGAFYFFANAYTLYAYGAALLVTTRYVKQGIDPYLRRGMMLMSAGLALLVFCFTVAVISNLLLWVGSPKNFPGIVILIATIAAFVGIPVFVIGLAYRSVTMRLIATRVWWQHLTAYHQLRPLWTMLHEEFPEDTLDRAPAGLWRDVLSLRGVHRRYYRRVIECRDGLVRLSPYLALHDDPTAGGGALATQVRQALRDHSAGAAVRTDPVLVAAPSEQGLDADVVQLVGLAQALRA